MKVTLDSARMRNRAQAHDYLQEKLELPSYYGGNLDALYDCLSAMGETELVVNGSYEPGSYCALLVRVMRSAERDNDALTVAVEQEPATKTVSLR